MRIICPYIDMRWKDPCQVRRPGKTLLLESVRQICRILQTPIRRNLTEKKRILKAENLYNRPITLLCSSPPHSLPFWPVITSSGLHIWSAHMQVFTINFEFVCLGLFLICLPVRGPVFQCWMSYIHSLVQIGQEASSKKRANE